MIDGFESKGSIFLYPRELGDDQQHSDQALRDQEQASIMYRKAEDSANRRSLAAKWMQDMVGPLKLSAEPSEQEFRQCLYSGLLLCRLINVVQPGAVPKVVENQAETSVDGVFAAYQYFENVRNFLMAVLALGMPSFQASDLESSSTVSSFSKVVECILAVKSYHEWRLRGGVGHWKHGVAVKSPLQQDCCPNSVLSFSSDENEAQGNEPLTEQLAACEQGGSEDEPGNCRLFNGLEAQSPSYVSSNVRTLLKGKKPEDIPMVVELLVEQIVGNYKKRFLAQGLQLSKLKNALKEASPSRNTIQESGSDQQIILEHLGMIKGLREASENTRQEVLNMKDNLRKDVEHLEFQLKSFSATEESYQQLLSENRKLYNEVQDLKGTIRVYCRVKPLLPGDADRSTVEFIGENGEILISSPKKQGKVACRSFNFNKVFGPSSSQDQVFLDTQPLIRSVLDGYNVCIFAYGQTGSGKTFTMSGPVNATDELWGVNYRALNDLFHISQSREATCRYEIGVQMVEIYNEQVRDLLAADGSTRKLEIRNTSQLNVPDASMLAVTSTQDVLELMRCGQKNRSIGATALNERSSRSHSVLTIHVHGKDLSGSLLRGCLHLIDLAGSERVNKSEATGDRLKEAQHINRSLSALGDVIAALSQKTAHVPYRNSKLTQLLQDSLGGQAKTLMFVHVNPDVESYGETVSTLKFAERVASTDLGAARSNKESAELRDLKEQIMTLKDSISKKDADLDKMQVLRNERRETSLQASFIEKHKRRQSMEEHESRTRKQNPEVNRNREGSSPVRGRRLSPPGSVFGYTQSDFDRLLSPSKAEGKKTKNSPRSPHEDYAPKSPYRERSRKQKNDQKVPKTTFLVESPSDDVDGADPLVFSEDDEAECEQNGVAVTSISELKSLGLIATSESPMEQNVPQVDSDDSQMQLDVPTQQKAPLMHTTLEFPQSLPQVEEDETQTSHRKSSPSKSGSMRGRRLQAVSSRRKLVTPKLDAKGVTYATIPLECHGKRTQLLSIETGISSKASKRFPWMFKEIKLRAMIM